MKTYEVYALTIHSSDLFEFDTYEKAKECADDWAKNCDCDIAVVEVLRHEIYKAKGQLK